MTNVTKCHKCDKSLISEEFADHICVPVYKPTKYVRVYYKDFFTVKNDDGTLSAVAEDEKGTIYLIDPTNRHLTGRNTNREDNRTRLWVLSNLRRIFSLSKNVGYISVGFNIPTIPILRRDMRRF